ncbi:MAG: S9 family peptidase, partial [Ignavibacterium sp.]
MYRTFKYFSLILFIVVLVIPVRQITKAQEKQLSFNQVYMFGEPRILKQLPRLQGWLDGEHYLFQKQDASTNAIIKANAKTGVEAIVLDFNAINSNLDEAEFSADENIAITKDYNGLLFYSSNDLFFYSI